MKRIFSYHNYDFLNRCYDSNAIFKGMMLNAKPDNNNFLAGIHFSNEDVYGLAFLDISTGEFFVAEGNQEYAAKLLQTLKPAEVIYQRNNQRSFKEKFGTKFYTYTLDAWIFDEAFATENLLKHFQTHSLKGSPVAKL